MNRYWGNHHGIRARALLAAAACACGWGIAAEPGRLLFACDDDWDWASPLGAKEPCGLGKYGKMSWSALDWAEEGLEEVRGVLVGSPPIIGHYLDMAQLNEIRKDVQRTRHYRLVAQRDNIVPEILAGDDPPNLVILMQDDGQAGPLGEEDAKALVRFVMAGGRLVVLDDRLHYQDLLGQFVKAVEKPGAPRDVETAAREDKELTAKFDALVIKLASDEFRVREEAARALRTMDIGILPLLEATKTDDPEVRLRLKELREEFTKLEVPPAEAPDNDSDPRQRDYEQAAQRIREAATALEKRGVSHAIKVVHANTEGGGQPALLVSVPGR